MRSMRNAFLGAAPGWGARRGAGAERRRFRAGAGDRTSSRASIMAFSKIKALVTYRSRNETSWHIRERHDNRLKPSKPAQEGLGPGPHQLGSNAHNSTTDCGSKQFF